MEVKANCDCTVYQDWDAFRADKKAGSVAFALSATDSEHYMWYYCPCGCGAKGALQIGIHVKPQADKPTWHWDADNEAPTLTPSVHHVGHWHGFLTKGKWISV